MACQLYHKIPKVEKSVCTVEQKVAYNIASVLDTNFGRKFREFAANSTESNIKETVHDMIRWGLNSYESAYKKSKIACNIDMVQFALNAGLENYLLHTKYRIFGDYAEIGRAFPAEYLKQ